MGKIEWELFDLEELLMRNDDVADWSTYTTICGIANSVSELEAENAKLRQLVADMWFWCYCGHMDSKSQEWQMKHVDEVIDRMRKLGIQESEE